MAAQLASTRKSTVGGYSCNPIIHNYYSRPLSNEWREPATKHKSDVMDIHLFWQGTILHQWCEIVNCVPVSHQAIRVKSQSLTCSKIICELKGIFLHDRNHPNTSVLGGPAQLWRPDIFSVNIIWCYPLRILCVPLNIIHTYVKTSSDVHARPWILSIHVWWNQLMFKHSLHCKHTKVYSIIRLLYFCGIYVLPSS